MKEKISFYSIPYPRIKSYYDLIDATAEHGLDYMEAYCFFELAEPDAEAAKKIREYADKKGVKFSCFSLFINLVGEDRRKQIERLKGFAEMAAILGSPYLHHTIVNDIRDPENVLPYKDEYFRLGIEAVREVYDHAETFGVKCIYEEQGYLFNGVENFKKFIDTVDRDIGIVADFGNICQVGEKVEDFIEAFSDKIMHVHVKDVIINDETGLKTSTGRYMREAVIGTGDVNIKKAIHLLMEKGYKGCYAIEYGAKTDDSSAMYEAIEYIKQAII